MIERFWMNACMLGRIQLVHMLKFKPAGCPTAIFQTKKIHVRETFEFLHCRFCFESLIQTHRILQMYLNWIACFECKAQVLCLIRGSYWMPSNGDGNLTITSPLKGPTNKNRKAKCVPLRFFLFASGFFEITCVHFQRKHVKPSRFRGLGVGGWGSCHGQTDHQPDDIAEWQVESLLASSKARLKRQKKKKKKNSDKICPLIRWAQNRFTEVWRSGIFCVKVCNKYHQFTCPCVQIWQWKLQLSLGISTVGRHTHLRVMAQK